jgi:hypothetical protein
VLFHKLRSNDVCNGLPENQPDKEAFYCLSPDFGSTDADGYTREALRPFEFLRRVPDQNWLKLIGAIGRDENSPIIIGSAMTNFSPSKSGELLCFANDVGWMYWNNRGSLRVTGTRTK